jgi:hypothetical protein
VPCHSGVGLTPVVDGTLHSFSAGGLHNGLFLLVDEETETYWDHITGEALHGPLAGKSLASWPISMKSVEQALEDEPDLSLLRSRPGIAGRLMGWFSSRGIRGTIWTSPFVHTQARRNDERLGRMENGLGVVHDGEARFYRVEDARRGVTDTWGGRVLDVHVRSDGIPFAAWQDGGEPPFQLFSRWYGFSASYPGCTLHGEG